MPNLRPTSFVKPASFHHSGLPRACITPLVITDPGAEAYPGVASGTGFFARKGREVFLLTALHCLESAIPPLNYLAMSKKLSIPFRLAGHTKRLNDYVLFDHVTRLAENENLESFVDVAALHVRPERDSNHKQLLSRAAKLPPTGLWLNRFASLERVQESMDAGEPITLVVIGYPNVGTSTAVAYDDKGLQPPEINVQPAQFTGNLRNGILDHCLLLQDTTWPHSHSGFSGAPVFVQWNSLHGKLSALAGLVICGADDSLHFIDVATLVRATERSASTVLNAA